MNINELTLSIVDALSTKNSDGVVTDFDYVGLKLLRDNLASLSKEHKAEYEAKSKASKLLAKEELNAKGKEYYNSLAVGAIFKITNSKGEVFDVRKIETKSNSGSTAACELLNPPADSKTAKRYPKFRFVVIA